MRIAFFDSGIGGLTVLSQALKQLPKAEYFYYADSQNVPYGTKDRQTIHGFVQNAVDFLSQFDLDALVIACNTATSVSVAALRERYDFPIIGMEPAVKMASLQSGKKKIAVTATSLTLAEKKLETLIERLNMADRVQKIHLDKLVVFAEQGDFNSSAVIHYLEQQLSGIDKQSHQSLVLGCTHFVYYRPLIEKILGKEINVLDGNCGTVNHLLFSLKDKMALSATQKIRFFDSGKEQIIERPQWLSLLAQDIS